MFNCPLAYMRKKKDDSVTATSARDQVIINPESAKRQWGRPGETVINALQEMALVETMSSNNSG